MLVILRLSLGCHFLYEGVWKIQHADEFSAKPFLTTAKGPLATVFYAMVPDLDGRERLAITEIEVEAEEDGGEVAKKEVISGDLYKDVWQDLHDRYVEFYSLSEEQQEEAAKVHGIYVTGLDTYLAENFEDIKGYFDSLDRFEAARRGILEGPEFNKARLWAWQQQLRGEVNGWLGAIDSMGESYQWALWEILDEDQKEMGPLAAKPVGPNQLPVPVPFVHGREDLVDKAVTYGLTAIGLCLMVGLFTRLAALGGAAFLISVLATQPPWPTIYPPFPDVVGHSMIVDKNFIEMVALLVVATTAVGRWGGLDFFLHRWIVKPLFSRNEPDAE